MDANTLHHPHLSRIWLRKNSTSSNQDLQCNEVRLETARGKILAAKNKKKLRHENSGLTLIWRSTITSFLSALFGKFWKVNKYLQYHFLSSTYLYFRIWFQLNDLLSLTNFKHIIARVFTIAILKLSRLTLSIFPLNVCKRYIVKNLWFRYTDWFFTYPNQLVDWKLWQYRKQLKKKKN